MTSHPCNCRHWRRYIDHTQRGAWWTVILWCEVHGIVNKRERKK